MKTVGKLRMVRGRADYAHFEGISLGPERTTMLIPSRSACVGILRSVYGKWEYRWAPERVTLHKKPTVVPIPQNQIKYFGCGDPVDIERQRTQRVWMFLYGVDFTISARITVGAHAGAGDNLVKAEEMISRRLQQGYRHYQPYCGLRECFAHLEDVSAVAEAADVTADYGLSFYDMDLDDPECPAYLAPLKVERGVVRYPNFDDVKKLGLRFRLDRVTKELT